MKTLLGVGGVLAASAALLIASPAYATTTNAVLHVPSDFDKSLSDTRANGHLNVIDTGLRIWTDGNGDLGADGRNSDKVAEYVGTNTPLAAVGEPSLDFGNTSNGGVPGYQLVVDFDGNGTKDGILVGEPIYSGDWWASDDSARFVKAGAPSTIGGSGSAWHGTLDGWRAAFPNAEVLAFGFSLGSGVKGDGVIDSITFAGTTYTFAADVTLTSKDECKNGGWAASTLPVYKNQGQCVSALASAKAEPVPSAPAVVSKPAAAPKPLLVRAV